MKNLKHIKKSNSKQYSLLLSISLLLISIFFITCKKYPEDKFAFRTVKARLEAEWKIGKIEMNGNDISSLYNDSLAPLALNSFHFWFVYNKLAPNPNKNDTRDLFIINKSSKNYKEAYDNNDVGITHFAIGQSANEKKSILNIGSENKTVIDTNSFSIFSKLLYSYSYKESNFIRSLYYKTLILQKEKNGNVYRIYFNRTKR